MAPEPNGSLTLERKGADILMVAKGDPGSGDVIPTELRFDYLRAMEIANSLMTLAIEAMNDELLATEDDTDASR